VFRSATSLINGWNDCNHSPRKALARPPQKERTVDKTTRIWPGDKEDSVPASSIKNLFPKTESSVELARNQLFTALEAERFDDTESLKSHKPPILGLISGWHSAVLLHFEILKVQEIAVGRHGEGVKPLKNVYSAEVSIEICDRPTQPATFEQIHLMRPNATKGFVEFVCKEFADDSWVFLHSELANG
jgi:hypothetical protein